MGWWIFKSKPKIVKLKEKQAGIENDLDVLGKRLAEIKANIENFKGKIEFKGQKVNPKFRHLQYQRAKYQDLIYRWKRESAHITYKIQKITRRAA